MVNCHSSYGLLLTLSLFQLAYSNGHYVQCASARCSLCNTNCPTTAHDLSSCPVALTQQQYMYWHNQVLFILATKFVEIFTCAPSIKVFSADLPDLPDLPDFYADNTLQ